MSNGEDNHRLLGIPDDEWEEMLRNMGAYDEVRSESDSEGDQTDPSVASRTRSRKRERSFRRAPSSPAPSESSSKW